HLAGQVGHGGAQREGELMRDQDGRHAVATLQQADVVAVQVGLGRQGLLGKAGGLPAPAQDPTELLLEWMHGSPTRVKRASATHTTRVIYTQPYNTLLCSRAGRVRLQGYASRGSRERE